ncbi:MAG: RNA polymerase subunit sigma-70 [Acidobacteria bacterium]|nr:RNA polymerase subunit sigma-70 [Acidobacteriota bacterium]MBS1865043.1 RNA polymerase subunit sigma-70 [Acidobacteriota bacterium]
MQNQAVSVDERELQARSMAEDVARRSYGKLVAFLAARTRDVAGAEDALAEAFVSALADWPRNGCPANPEAWLLTAARRKAIDGYRGQQRHNEAANEIKAMNDGLEAAEKHSQIPDQRLGLMFACAHPAIDAAVRAPLILQVVLGLDAAAIGSAFLVSPAAMGKRLVRAKEKIKQAGIPFVIPEREELAAKLDVVLDAIYAAFAEGWTDPTGGDVARRDLTEESLFLARLVVELLPNSPEAFGLLALMLHAEARKLARRTAEGEFVPLAEQDVGLWDSAMITEAESLLRRASKFQSPGRYQLEAALQSAHVHRLRTGQWNWPDVARLYDALLSITGSPVVAINRALAIAEVDGAEAGLRILEKLSNDPRLAEYQPYWAARAELFARTDKKEEARKAYEIAIGLEKDPVVRRFLQKRQSTLEF